MTPSERRREYERARAHRKHAERGRTIDLKRTAKRDLLVERALNQGANKRHLPLTRGECIDGPRPCPFVSCQHHLALDVLWNGNVKLNFPDLVDHDGDLDLARLPATCALDVADEGGVTLNRVGELMNLTRERVRQIECEAFDEMAEERVLLSLGSVA